MSLQASAVVRLDADTGIHREAAVLVGQHLFGLETLQQATAHKGAQYAPAQGCLRLGYHGLIDSGGGVEDPRWRGCCVIAIRRAHHFLKHPVNHTHMKVHMPVQAGATTKLQCRQTCTQVMSELNRWMMATAPMCSAALATCAALGL